MAEHWANLDLHLDVDLAGSRPGRSLEHALRTAVGDGRLPPGTRLPSSRALAADLGIARNTVADAYGQLAAEGWLSTRTGAGTWVTTLSAAGAARQETPRPAVRQPGYDLHAGVPDLSAFPRREWLAAARRALAAAPDHLLHYPDPRGVPRLREVLAGYLARARGVAADPERIVVCAGFTHGLALLSQVLGARGARAVAVEAYGLPEHRAVLSRGGLRLAALPVDADGAVPELGVLRGAGAALLTPAHQFPLGMTLAPARRRVFAEWAAGAGAVLIEDDYDGEFRYDRHPVGAMQALAPDHVVYGGTASKALAPGLRMGWLAVPGRLVDDVAAAARLDGGPDVVSQLTLAEFIACGGYDRRVRHARLAYRRRRDQLVSALGRAAPAARVTGIAAGLHAVVNLPPGRRESDAIAGAARHGVAV
ncbi:PLP-dependent aminotransferase family protein, partial [Trebonia sp.]|uniref:MocR-like pyridoxine biosynthesis transcription factor PdxR n=1 Tax=Trebonia sp. TaxID=2767075 RepID=UPI002639DB7E